MKSLVYIEGNGIKGDVCLFCPALIKTDYEIKNWVRSGTSDHYYDWSENWAGVNYRPIEPFYEFGVSYDKGSKEKILNNIENSFNNFFQLKSSSLNKILRKKINLRKPIQKFDFSQNIDNIINSLLEQYKIQLKEKKENARIILVECLDIDILEQGRAVSQKSLDILKSRYPYHYLSESYDPYGLKCHVSCWPFGEFKDKEMVYGNLYKKIHPSHLTNIIREYYKLFGGINLFKEIMNTKIEIRAKQSRLVIKEEIN